MGLNNDIHCFGLVEKLSKVLEREFLKENCNVLQCANGLHMNTPFTLASVFN